MSLFKNASPEVLLLGADDKSTRQITPSEEPIPQHCPLFFIFGERGTTKRVLVGGSKLIPMYGASTFDINDKYYTHATLFMQAAISKGNTCVVERVTPSDAGVRSNVIVYMDVLKTEVPNYVRDTMGYKVEDESTGGYKVDEDTPLIDGYLIKYITDYETEETELGLLTPKTGTMTDGATTSTMYPIFQAKAKYQGEYYNNIGFSIGTLFGEKLDNRIVKGTKSLPYALTLYTRPSQKHSPVVFKNLFGEPSTNFSFYPKVINPNTEARMDFEDIFESMWFNETDSLKSLKYFDYENIYFYRSNFELVTKLFLEEERKYVTDETFSQYDFTTADEEIEEEFYVVNPFACKTSKNIPYRAVMYSEEEAVVTGNQKEINMSLNTPVFLKGGSDGTLSNEEFEKAVVARLAEYLDPDSEVIDTAVNVESALWDSGFTLPTKRDLFNFIALRKDTYCVLSTHDYSMGEKRLPLSEERAIAVSLRTRAQMFPESEYHGTGVARAVIVAGESKLRTGITKNYVPATYDLIVKTAAMMGAGNGLWKRGEVFDKYPGNALTETIEYEPRFIPAGIKPTLWNDGIVWAQPYDRKTYHFPALQTVYSNDTSVLNNFFAIACLCTVTKIGALAWRRFTGSTALTNSEFIREVENFVNEQLKDRFAGMFVVVPEVIITEEDEQRGYSWRLITAIYGNNMKTKMVHYSTIYRMSDLEQ